MQADDPRPEWVICHQVARTAAGLLVRCPRRGQVLSDECLRCRFLTTSSIERTFGPWCEVAPAPAEWAATATGRALPRDAEAPRPSPVAVQSIPISSNPPSPALPAAMEPTPAVRPPQPVPSGHAIGT